MINWIEKAILVIFFEDAFHKLIFHQLCKFSDFDARSVVLVKTKVFDRNIKETRLAKYFKKVTARPSFTRLIVVRQKIEFIKYQNTK